MQVWIDQLPLIKQARDFHYSEAKNTAEREFQQVIIRTNNYERTSNSSDFFITDMEYDNIGKIDLLALEWNSNNRSSNSLKTKFAFIEVKFGNGAVKGESGLNKHLDDIHNFIVNQRDEYLELVQDTEKVFKQKRELHLYNLGTNSNHIELQHIEHGKPYFIVLLADYKVKDNNLMDLINEIDVEKYNSMDIKFSVANLMGYGLYSNCLYNKNEILDHINKSK